MEVIETIEGLDRLQKGCVLTIGNFDGVHLGHQAILAAGRKTAAERSADFVVMTFEPHPAVILHPEKAPGVLTTLQLKKELLSQEGAACLVVLKDSVELLGLSPADFVEKFLVKHIEPSVVVEGEDFNFGAGRRGSVHTLYNLGKEKGFEVSIVEAREVKLSIGQSVRVSSTIIRNLLEAGKVADAVIALGRAYRLIGEVVPGRGKGKQLGFPTLNMERPAQIIPAEGVYAGTVEIGDSCGRVCVGNRKIPAVFSIGYSQTLGGDQPLLIEAHLLKEDSAEFRGKWMAMDFVEFIRGQEKFGTEKELSEQIAKDCENAKRILNG